MIQHILLAVDDSPASMAATQVAIEMASRLDAEVYAATVIVNHAVDERLAAALDSRATLTRRRDQAAASVLRHVARLAARAGVPVRTLTLYGEPAPCLLKQAREWPADLVVMGHASRPGAGQHYVGAQTQHVLEFAEQPVLVVPATTAKPAWRTAKVPGQAPLSSLPDRGQPAEDQLGGTDR